MSLELYIVPKNRNRIVIPFHRCQVEFETLGIPTTESNWVRLYPARGEHYKFGIAGRPGSLTIESTLNEIIIDGPGKLSLEATAGRLTLPDNSKNCDVHISVHLLPTDANRPVVLTITLPYPKEK